MARKHEQKHKKKTGDEKVAGPKKSFMFNDDKDPDILEHANKIMQFSGEKTIRSAIRKTVRKALQDERDRLEPDKKAS